MAEATGSEESWSFSFVDPDARSHGVAQMSIPVDGRAGSLAIGLWGHDGSIYTVGKSVPRDDSAVGAAALGPLRVTQRGEDQWQIELDDDGITVSWQWEALGQRHESGWSERLGGRHEHQVGVSSGTIQALEETFRIGGLGGRELVRGTDLRSVGRQGFVLSGPLADESYVYCAVASSPGRDEVVGYVLRDGVASDLLMADLSCSFAYDGGPPGVSHLNLEVGDGEALQLTVDLSGVFSSTYVPPMEPGAGWTAAFAGVADVKSPRGSTAAAVSSWHRGPDAQRCHVVARAVGAQPKGDRASGRS